MIPGFTPLKRVQEIHFLQAHIKANALSEGFFLVIFRSMNLISFQTPLKNLL